MAVDNLPKAVGKFLKDAGLEWPYLNERAARDFQRMLHEHGREMLRIQDEATDSVAVVAAELVPEDAEEALADWESGAESYALGVVDQIEAFCALIPDFLARTASCKSEAVGRLEVLARESAADWEGAVASAKQVMDQMQEELLADIKVVFDEKLTPLLEACSRPVETDSMLSRGEARVMRGGDVDVLYAHAQALRRHADASLEAGRHLQRGLKTLKFGARPRKSDDAEPPAPELPSGAFAVWRGRTYAAEPAGPAAVRLSLPEQGGPWPHPGGPVLWPGELDSWLQAAGPGETAAPDGAGRTDLLAAWRLAWAEETFRFFTPSFGDIQEIQAADTVCGAGEFATWRGRRYGAQNLHGNSVRLFQLPGQARTPVIPDLARHGRGRWTAPGELDEWYAVWTTFYVGDDAYMALAIDRGLIHGLRAYTPRAARASFALDEIDDLLQERRDLLAEWRRRQSKK